MLSEHVEAFSEESSQLNPRPREALVPIEDPILLRNVPVELMRSRRYAGKELPSLDTNPSLKKDPRDALTSKVTAFWLSSARFSEVLSTWMRTPAGMNVLDC